MSEAVTFWYGCNVLRHGDIIHACLDILRVLGFEPRRVRRVVAAQAATLSLLAVVFGVPIGLIVGRQIWLSFAERLQVVPEAVTPAGLLPVVVASLVVGQIVAVVPAWLAARRALSPDLRAE